MKRRALLPLLALATLLLLSMAPVAAQDEATPEPLPTSVPYSDESLVQTVLFFSPTCGHCHYVITETLPPLFDEHGGMPITSYDQSVPVEDVTFYLMSNGRLQILFVDTSTSAGQAMFLADSVRLGIDSPGVPRVDVEDAYMVGSDDIPEQFPGIVADALASEGISWPAVPGLDTALAPFVEMGAVPEFVAATEPESVVAPPA